MWIGWGRRDLGAGALPGTSVGARRRIPAGPSTGSTGEEPGFADAETRHGTNTYLKRSGNNTDSEGAKNGEHRRKIHGLQQNFRNNILEVDISV